MTEEQKRVARLKYELAIRDYRQSDVARECSVEPTTVGAVIHGRSRSRKIETRIAAITRLPLAELWPQWYGEYASRRRRARAPAKSAESRHAVAG